MTLENLFRSSNRARDKFLSRLFGIFNEEVVRCWCRDTHCPYENLGTATIKGSKRRLPVEFAFKRDAKIYLTEMKCELEYCDYRFITLQSPSQLTHHKKESFQLFLDLAKDPQQHAVTIKGERGKPQEIELSGCILIWGAVSDAGRASVIDECHFYDILSLEQIIADLREWENQDYYRLLDEYEAWSEELFEGLRQLGPKRSVERVRLAVPGAKELVS